MIITDELMKYAEDNTSGESKVLAELRAHCFSHFEDASMLSGRPLPRRL